MPLHIPNWTPVLYSEWVGVRQTSRKALPTLSDSRMHSVQSLKLQEVCTGLSLCSSREQTRHTEGKTLHPRPNTAISALAPHPHTLNLDIPTTFPKNSLKYRLIRENKSH